VASRAGSARARMRSDRRSARRDRHTIVRAARRTGPASNDAIAVERVPGYRSPRIVTRLGSDRISARRCSARQSRRRVATAPASPFVSPPATDQVDPACDRRKFRVRVVVEVEVTVGTLGTARDGASRRLNGTNAGCQGCFERRNALRLVRYGIAVRCSPAKCPVSLCDNRVSDRRTRQGAGRDRVLTLR